jgi:single-strand DNA-binding protein
LNVITLTGGATKDLELRYTPNGKAVTTGSIAVKRDRPNQAGEYETDFFNFVALGKMGEIMANHIKKGDFFGITGRLQNRTWENENGKKYYTEVLASGFDWPQKKSGNSGGNTSSNTGNNPPNDPFEGVDVSDDDLPF